MKFYDTILMKTTIFFKIQARFTKSFQKKTTDNPSMVNNIEN